MKLRFVTVLSFLLLLVAPAHAMAGDETPSWVQQAAALKVPSYDKDVSAVVLVDDSTTNIDAQGYVTETYKYAVRILKREGRVYAEGGVGYIPEIAKIKDFRAWLVRPSGDIKRYGKDETVDLAAADNDVYNEYRLKEIKAVHEADAGTVFAYSYSREDRSVFSQ